MAHVASTPLIYLLQLTIYIRSAASAATLFLHRLLGLRVQVYLLRFLWHAAHFDSWGLLFYINGSLLYLLEQGLRILLEGLLDLISRFG